MAEDEKPAGGRSLFWLAYGQIAAMLGALSMLVFLTHLFDFELRGAVRDAVGVWTQVVRPLVGDPIQWLVNFLPANWRFEVGGIVKDYFAVALTFALSNLRAVLRFLPDELLSVGLHRVGLFFGGLLMLVALVRLLALWLLWLLWPLLVPILLIGPLTGVKQIADRTVALSTLAPLIYLGLLFAANAWLV
jgi:hypothetical protein